MSFHFVIDPVLLQAWPQGALLMSTQRLDPGSLEPVTLLGNSDNRLPLTRFPLPKAPLEKMLQRYPGLEEAILGWTKTGSPPSHTQTLLLYTPGRRRTFQQGKPMFFTSQDDLGPAINLLL